ncbi:MAG: type II toxin-antitoxin system RelE/ParE family toxin [Betaproteobacteria bacterium]|nr:type II toxin-antitoxin system RelE/ParE family toxin [Betaproteobacteria bacterium]
MPRVIWSPASLQDMQRLYRALANKNPEAAKRAIKTIRESLKTMAQLPDVGRPVDHMEADYREWLIDFGSSGYTALYHYDGRVAVILAVRHQREAGY